MTSNSIEEMKRQVARMTATIEADTRRERAKAEAEQKRAVETFERTKGVHVGLSDDYASLRTGRFGPVYREANGENPVDFYYGYEETFCPKHGTDEDACDRAGCEESEWAFVVKENGVETMRLGQSQLHPECDGVEECLFCGIGLWISEKMRPSSPTP